MTPPVTLESTLEYRRMLEKGVTPEQLQETCAIQFRQQVVNVAQELVRRGEAVEGSIGELVNLITKNETFPDIEQGLVTLKETKERVQETKDSLSEQLENQEKVLEKQKKQKEQVLESIRSYQSLIKNTPTQTEERCIQMGQQLSKNLGRYRQGLV